MADFNNHISQAKRNISFLSNINSSCNEYWDWQVTVCFYVAVHVINAHLDKSAGLHYKTHEDVKNAINPKNQLSISSVPDNVYISFTKLLNLSRRSRYLIHDEHKNDASITHFTHDVHLKKALFHLDVILKHFSNKYSIEFEKTCMACGPLNNSLEYFTI